MSQNCVKIYVHLLYPITTSYEISTDKLQKHVHVVITQVPIHILNLNLSIYSRFDIKECEMEYMYKGLPK